MQLVKMNKYADIDNIPIECCVFPNLKPPQVSVCMLNSKLNYGR